MRAVYVAGWMRSGTTLLGEMLGAQPGVFNAGEVSGLWTSVAEGRPCACGLSVRDCEIWGPALEELDSAGMVSPTDYAALGQATASLFRTRKMARLLSATEEASSTQWVIDSTERVLRAAATQAGAEVVVDTSKLVPGMIRYRMQNWPTQIVEIFRDPRAVVASAARTVPFAAGNVAQMPPGERAIKTLAHWYYANFSAILASRLLGFPLIRLSYEDMMAAPARLTEKLCDRLEVPYSASTFTTSELRMTRSHAAVGNPSRLVVGNRRLLVDDRWRTELPRTTAVAVNVLAAPGTGLLKLGRLR